MTEQDKLTHLSEKIDELEQSIRQRSSGSRRVSFLVLVLTSFLAAGILTIYSFLSTNGEGPLIDILLNLGTEIVGALIIAIITVIRLSFRKFNRENLRIITEFGVFSIIIAMAIIIGVFIVFSITNETSNLHLTINLTTELVGAIAGVLILEEAIRQLKEESKEDFLSAISEMRKDIQDLRSK